MSVLAACGGVATSGTLLSLNASSVRIKSITIWSPPGAAINATASITWFGVNVPDKEISDTAFGNTFPAYVRSTPPPNSQASYFQRIAPAYDMCKLEVTSGAIIDVVLDHTINGDNALLSTVNQAGMTSGVPYFGRLDGYASGLLVPVGLNSV